jgi:hypothetical protein
MIARYRYKHYIINNPFFLSFEHNLLEVIVRGELHQRRWDNFDEVDGATPVEPPNSLILPDLVDGVLGADVESLRTSAPVDL